MGNARSNVKGGNIAVIIAVATYPDINNSRRRSTTNIKFQVIFFTIDNRQISLEEFDISNLSPTFGD